MAKGPGSAPKDNRHSIPKAGQLLLGTRVKKKTAARHRLDKRAHLIVAAEGGNDDDLLTTAEVAAWFGVSHQWLEIGRHRGYGPPFERLSYQVIRYRRGTARAWLADRTHTVTSEYSKRVPKRHRAAGP